MKRPSRHQDGDRSGPRPAAAERARERWGVDRILLVHGTEQRHGADLGRVLLQHLRHLPVALLYDRVLPGCPAHLAVGPGGITVIAELPLAGPLRVELLRGVFGARADLLHDGDVDISALVEDLEGDIEAVRTLIGGLVPVAGALCRDAAAGPALLHPLYVGDVLVGGPQAVARMAARDGDLSDTALTAVVDLLDRICPPVAA